MSNLIKSVYFNNTNAGEKMMIDSDSKIEKYVPDIYSRRPSDGYGEDAPDSGDEDFRGGINVISMDGVLEEERRRISDEAKEEIDAMLADAREQADKIISEANAMAANIKNDAYEEGKSAGFREGGVKAAEALKERQAQLEADFEKRQEALREREQTLEPRFADVMAGLIEKITGVVCQDKKDVIVHLIDNAIRGIEKTERIVVRVSKGDMPRVSAGRGELAACVKEGTEFDIVEDASLSARQCIIETDDRIIDCSLDAQLESLRDQIRLLAV